MSELSPSEIYRRNIATMEPRQLRSHLNRKARTGTPDLTGAFAIIMAHVYTNTEAQLVDDDGNQMNTEFKKNFGTLSPGLR